MAICRLRGQLSRARTLLYDCVYFFQPEAYALTYTIVSVWAEVTAKKNHPLQPMPTQVNSVEASKQLNNE